MPLFGLKKADEGSTITVDIAGDGSLSIRSDGLVTANQLFVVAAYLTRQANILLNKAEMQAVMADHEFKSVAAELARERN